jgi:hypothetical protein
MWVLQQLCHVLAAAVLITVLLFDMAGSQVSMGLLRPNFGPGCIMRQ